MTENQLQEIEALMGRVDGMTIMDDHGAVAQMMQNIPDLIAEVRRQAELPKKGGE